MKRTIIFLATISLFSSCEEQNKTESKKNEEKTEEKIDSIIDNHTEKLKEIQSNALTKCLDEIGNTEYKNVFSCLEKHKDLIKLMTPTAADSLYFIVLDKMDKIKFTDLGTEYEEDVEKRYHDAGFFIDNDEGFYFVSVDRKLLGGKFYPFVSTSMKLYLDFKENNQDNITNDGGLVISPMDIAKRLVEMESLLEVGNVLWMEEIKRQYVSEIRYFIYGLDNTPTYDHNAKTFFQESLDAFAYAMGNGGKVTKVIMEKFNAIVSNDNWVAPDYLPSSNLMDEKEMRNRLDENYQ